MAAIDIEISYFRSQDRAQTVRSFITTIFCCITGNSPVVRKIYKESS